MSSRAQLDQLFASLRAQNITAVQRCGFSMNDGMAELEEYRLPEHAGYCFFHEQDAWRAAAGGKLYLAYGTYRRQGSSAMAVAELVYANARECGLAIKWDGSVGARMEIGGLDAAEFEDWREPPPSDEDEEGDEPEGGSEAGQTDGSGSAGGGGTGNEVDKDGGEGEPRVALPSYLAAWNRH